MHLLERLRIGFPEQPAQAEAGVIDAQGKPFLGGESIGDAGQIGIVGQIGCRIAT